MLTFKDLQAMEKEAAEHEATASRAKERARRASEFRRGPGEILDLGSGFNYSWNEAATEFLKPKLDAAAREFLRDFELQQEGVAKDHARKAQALRDRIQALIVQPLEEDQP